jgi:hypothetical protein
MDDNINPTQMQDVEEQLDEQSNEQQNLDNEIETEDVVTAPAEDATDEEQEDEPSLTPRQEKRVNQIEQQAKELGMNKILDRIQAVRETPSQRQRQDPLDYRQAIDAPDEVYEQLASDRDAYGRAQREEGVQDASRNSRLDKWELSAKIDYPLVAEKLKTLAPEDVDVLNREYFLVSGVRQSDGGGITDVANPNIGYADFINARIEQAERLATRMNINTQKNVARQAANTGLRPDGTSAKPLNLNKAPHDMSDAELDAYIKRAIPSK